MWRFFYMEKQEKQKRQKLYLHEQMKSDQKKNWLYYRLKTACKVLSRSPVLASLSLRVQVYGLQVAHKLFYSIIPVHDT